MKLIPSFTALLLCFAFSASAQVEPEFNITQDLVEGQLRFLASDELQGRRTGEAGNNIAAKYIAEQFRSMGIQPGPGMENYYQVIPFQQKTPPQSGALQWGEKEFKVGEDLIVLNGDPLNVEAKAIFAGHGLENEEKGWDDYKGLKVEGKIVVVVGGVPNSNNPMETFEAMKTKRELAKAKGAVALIELYRLPFPWQYFKQFMNSERLEIPDAGGNNQDGFSYLWLKEDSKDDALNLKKKKIKMTLSHSGIKSKVVNSQNVVGYIPGTDPALKDEALVLTAHYDHVGTGVNGGGAYTPEDSIFNGARDNAMGVVAILSAAKAISEKPTKRPILLLAFTGEEMGLLGSKYYATNPIIPHNKTIFNLNTDGAGYNDTTSIAIIGWDRTGTNESIIRATETFGLGIIKNPAPEQGLFDRSDNVSFAVEGVPCANFSPGLKTFDDVIGKYYHQAADNPETIDIPYLQKYAQAFARTARLIADDAEKPWWKAGDKYEEAGKKLYNK